jgi:hypothetical protein
MSSLAGSAHFCAGFEGLVPINDALLDAQTVFEFVSAVWAGVME